MTVTTTASRDVNNGNGATTVFPVSFKFFVAADLVVTHVLADGTENLKILTTDYTVTGDGPTATGVVTTTSFTAATGTQVVVERALPQTQAIDYTANDPFPAETNEEGLDRGVMLSQQLDDLLQRAITLPKNTTQSGVTVPTLTGNTAKFPRVNAAEDAFEYVTPLAAGTITIPVAIAEGGTASTTAAAARTALGTPGFGQGVNAQAAPYTIVAGDIGKVVNVTSAGTVTLPSLASVPNPFVVAVKNSSGGTVTLDGNGADTIDGSATFAMTEDKGAVVLFHDGTSWFVATRTSADALIAPSGTSMLFHQTAAPTGWTKQVAAAFNNTGLRVVTGTISTGGADDFSAVFGTGKATDSHALTTAELPAHTHNVLGIDTGTGSTNTRVSTNIGSSNANSDPTSSVGSNTGHTHNISNLDLKFRDVIVADKD